MKKRFIFILFLSALQLTVFAQQPKDKPANNDSINKQLKDDVKEVLNGDERKARFFESLSVGVDMAGPVMRFFGSQGDYTAFVQMNIKAKYLPVVELGYGDADKNEFYTKIKYKAHGPFGRIGCDLNIIKNKLDVYRLTVGLRYGFTHFNYDTSTPDSTKTVFTDTSGSCTLHWAELVFGVDAKVWGPLHMGWTVRYRRKISCKYDDCDPLYAPGFGNATESSRWMALYTIGIQI